MHPLGMSTRSCGNFAEARSLVLALQALSSNEGPRHKPTHVLPSCLMLYLWVQHGAGKPTPWRVRGTPLGVCPAAGPSQVPNSEDINAAMAAAGDLAAFFPSTQAEPEVDASAAAHSTAEPPSSAGTTAAAAAAAPKSNLAAASAAVNSNSAAARTDEDGAQAAPMHAALLQQASASTDAKHGHDPKAASRSADKASHAQPDEAEDDQTCRGAGPGQASRRNQSGSAAVDEEEEGHGSAGGRGRGRGSRGKGRGQGRGRGRGRKRNSPDTANVEDAIGIEKPQVNQRQDSTPLMVQHARICITLCCTMSQYITLC